ncbi:MAG: GNAT family N-acetyltransferase [Pseudomonadota bacterium]
MSPNYQFRHVVREDLPLLAQWRSEDHVRRWWGDDELLTEADLKDQNVVRWIVSLESKPFAYLQDYLVHAWVAHPFAYLPKDARGMDQFIGDADFLGLGHGPGFMRQRIHQLFQSGTPVVATDPHPENARAIAAYRKVGFEVDGPVQETQWGTILPMVCKQDPGQGSKHSGA